MMDSNKTLPVSDEHILNIKAWLKGALTYANFELKPLAGDASFRRYYRVQNSSKSYVLMDAPPELETSEPFIRVAQEFKALGLCVPEIYALDLQQGFVLLSDLGDRLLLGELNEHSVDQLYQCAIDSLLLLQTCQGITAYTIAQFDQVLYRREFDLFTEWYLDKLLNITLSPVERADLTQVFKLLIEDAIAQPQVLVHRDYHSRNLLVLDNDQMGILDFQDALWGPISYDLLSLLRDCYIAWPQHRITAWVRYYYQRALATGVLQSVDFTQFMRWFDWIGIQRHLKCLGIFSRLNLRDGKAGYLNDVPRVLHYAHGISAQYKELEPLTAVLAKCQGSAS